MFAQIIQGKVRDADLLQKQMDRWREEIKPGAVGFLGSTGGVTADGEAILIARFESPDAARANSVRPEQGSWWAETAPAFDGEPTFRDCDDVDLMFDGGSEMAGFVQVMQGRAVDPKAMRATGQAMEADLRHRRSDILGGIVAWHGDREFTQVVYFSSEDDARKGEATMQDDSSSAEWEAMIDGPMTFIDLRRPMYD
jgi:hypothetical protein